MEVYRVEVQGRDAVINLADNADRRVQRAINRTIRELEATLTPLLRVEAPHDTGELAAGIDSFVSFRGGLVSARFAVEARRDGFDYVPVSRFGHLVATIYPRRKRALTVPRAGRGSATALRSKVRGARPAHDWFDAARAVGEKETSAAVRKLSREIDTVIVAS